MSSLDLEQYRALVEHAPTLVWRAGLDARCDYFNATWLTFTGRTLEQELGNGWTEGVHPDDFERCLAVYVESFAAQKPFEIEYRLRRADGVFRYVLARGAPYTDAEGEFVGFIGSCVDIDDRRKADEAKQVFLTMIAHELRTPLMTLRTSSTLLRRRLAAGNDVESTLTSVERQVDRFSRVVASLSEVSRLDAGRALTLDVAPIDIWQLVRDVVGEYGEVLRARPHQRCTLALELPDTPLEIDVDTERVRQVLVNLIENAIKYSPYGGGVTLRGEATHAGGAALSVVDRGIGIPEADQPLVLRRFFRASNAAPENFPGVGLGLSIASEIVKAHGGALSVQSKVGEGTRVTFTLPARGQEAQS